MSIESEPKSVDAKEVVYVIAAVLAFLFLIWCVFQCAKYLAGYGQAQKTGTFPKTPYQQYLERYTREYGNGPEIRIEKHRWSTPIFVHEYDSLSFNTLETNVWLETKINDSETICQAPYGTPAWKPIERKGVQKLKWRICTDHPQHRSAVATARVTWQRTRTVN